VERVAFLLEPSGRRLECLLNPESLLVRREAGLRPLGASVGHLAGAGLRDERLLATGGGRMEIQLDLLFDTSLVRGEEPVEDVTRLTRPFWDLAENFAGDGGYGRLPRVRFVWGKDWNLPGVVAAVAERLERFTPAGTATRSWMRMRLLRVAEIPSPERAEGPPPPPPEALAEAAARLAADEGAELPAGMVVEPHTIRGAGGAEGPRERLDQIAERTKGDAALWRLDAYLNGITDPLDLVPNGVLWVARQLGRAGGFEEEGP